MKILILEDEDAKFDRVSSVVEELLPDVHITRVSEYIEYIKNISANSYDLLLIDLIVKGSRSSPKTDDYRTQILEETRAIGSRSFSTPAIVLTQYLESADTKLYKELNAANIIAIHYDSESKEWEDSLKSKILETRPAIRFDIVILCALPKEAEAYSTILEGLGPVEEISGLMGRRFRILEFTGVIIIFPRMGLVSSAVISACAIERFNPALVAMSGICGGIPNEAKIYDTFVSEICYQHDAGKWGENGFKTEHYDVQIDSTIRNTIEKIIRSSGLKEEIRSGIQLSRTEFPEGSNEFDFVIDFAATSSGSAVLAEEGKTSELPMQQRKLRAFEMEIYSVYEACRLSISKPKFFAVKSVVDDGGKNKGDRFHRVGCLLSAKLVIKCITALKIRN